MPGLDCNHDIAVEWRFVRIGGVRLAINAKRLRFGDIPGIGHTKINGAEAIIGQVRSAQLGLLTRFGAQNHTCIRGPEFQPDALWCCIGRNRLGIDIVVKSHEQFGRFIGVGLVVIIIHPVDIGLGQPGLDNHTAGTVRDIGQVGGVHVGRHIGAAGRCRGNGRVVISLGCNILNENLIAEVPENGEILSLNHKVHLVEAHYAIRLFIIRESGIIFGAKNRVIRIQIFPVYQNIGGLKVLSGNRSLIQIYCRFVGLIEEFRVILHNARRLRCGFTRMLELVLGGNLVLTGPAQFYAIRQIAGVQLLLGQFVVVQLLIPRDETVLSAIGNQRAFERVIDNGITDGRKMTNVRGVGAKDNLGPVSDERNAHRAVRRFGGAFKISLSIVVYDVIPIRITQKILRGRIPFGVNSGDGYHLPEARLLLSQQIRQHILGFPRLEFGRFGTIPQEMNGPFGIGQLEIGRKNIGVHLLHPVFTAEIIFFHHRPGLSLGRIGQRSSNIFLKTTRTSVYGQIQGGKLGSLSQRLGGGRCFQRRHRNGKGDFHLPFRSVVAFILIRHSLLPRTGKQRKHKEKDMKPASHRGISPNT